MVSRCAVSPSCTRPRIELTGFDADDVPGLKARGLIGEIISWKLRLFLPMSEEGPRILAKLLEQPSAHRQCAPHA